MRVGLLSFILGIAFALPSFAHLEVCNRYQNYFYRDSDVDLFTAGSFDGPAWRAWLERGGSADQTVLFLVKSATCVESPSGERSGCDDDPSFSIRLYAPNVNDNGTHLNFNFGNQITTGDFQTSHLMTFHSMQEGSVSVVIQGPGLCSDEDCEEPGRMLVHLGAADEAPFYVNKDSVRFMMGHKITTEVSFWHIELRDDVALRVVKEDNDIRNHLGCVVFD